MRDDIEHILNRRPSWILHNDKDYQDLRAALEYARKEGNTQAVEELELWLEQRKVLLLGD